MEICVSNRPEDIVCTLSSGSKGNAVYLSLDGTHILIDAGISTRRIECAVKSLGDEISALDAVFITHEHSDHIRALPVLTKKCTAEVHAPEKCVPYISCRDGALCGHSPAYSVGIGNLEVESFITPHDSRSSVGYIVRSESRTVGICTDLGYMPDYIMQQLLRCDSVIIESNHDLNMLKYGGYPAALKARIRSNTGHLSNKDCAAVVVSLARAGVENIILAHLSEENNTPELAFRTSADALEQNSVHTHLAVAESDNITFLIHGSRKANVC